MKLIDRKFETANGRTLRRYTVRSLGPGRGFCPLDKLRGFFLLTNPESLRWTRKQAWEYLRTHEA